MTLIDDLRASKVLAILRRSDIAQVAVPLFERLHAQGIRAVECTLDQPGALPAIEALVAIAPGGTIVGAGTVTTCEQLDRLASIGARFAVTPHLDPALIEHAIRTGVPLIPGVMTPTEIVTAQSLGALAVKLFPAGPLGPAYLKTLLGPFPDLAVIPTGGIEVGDVPLWLKAGAVAVGLGSALTGPDGVPDDLRLVLADRA